VLLGASVQSKPPVGPTAQPTQLTLSDGTSLAADLVLWCTGAKPNTAFLGEELTAAGVRDGKGLIKVLPTLQVEGQPHMFALGDCNNVPEEKKGFLAMKQAELAAQSIKALIRAASSGGGGNARSPKLGTWTVNMGMEVMVVTLGRNDGVCRMGGNVFTGCLPATVKGKDLFIGKTRGQLKEPVGCALVSRLDFCDGSFVSHPKLEGPLILILRRGKLPTPDFPTTSSFSHQDIAGSAANVNANANANANAAMSALAVHSHEAWQQLAERHFLSRPGPVFDCLSPDQLALVAAAFSRAGYHHVELFRSIADRLLPAVPHLQPGSLARALHAFASLRHNDPHFISAMCREVHCRMRGGGAGGGAGGAGGDAAVGSAAAGGVGTGSSLLSLAGAALFGSTRGGRPDRAHRAPQFLLDDLARLAAAAVQLGVSEAAARGYGSRGGGGSAYGDGLGGQLLEAVAEEAEEAAAVRLRSVVEAVRATAAAAAAAAAAGAGEVSHPATAMAAPNEPRPRSRAPWESNQIQTQPGVDDNSSRTAYGEYDGYDRYGTEGVGVDGQEPDASDRFGNGDARELCGPWVTTSSSSSSWGSGSSTPVDQLEPVLTLLEALAVGSAAGGAGCAAAHAAHAITAQHLVPELPSLEPYMAPRHLVSMLAALLPGPGAASLLQLAHPYPGPPPPQRLSSLSRSLLSGDGGGRGGGGGCSSYIGKRPAAEARRGDDAPGEHLSAVVAALSRRSDLRVFRSGRHVLDAWHMLAASHAGGAAGTDDPRVTGQLLAPVFAFVVRHVTMLGSAPEASRFFVSCALLSAYDRAALDAMAAPLVAALGAGGGAAGTTVKQPPSGQRQGVRDGSAARWNTTAGCRTGALTPQALAQLAWAVGQLGYDNTELLTAIQPHADEDPAAAAAGGGAAAAAAAEAAAAGLAAAAPPLGPLELADVMWCLAVNQFRTNLGAEIRELYMRAATHGVVHIDDPRWLRLVQVHVLLLLGWAGGLGEAAAGRLRSSWFNALGYAWEHQISLTRTKNLMAQAVDRGEQLAGPTGLPPDPDAAVRAFRHGVTTSVRDLSRAGIPPAVSPRDVSGSNSSSSSGTGGRLRLQTNYVWGMLQPSSDIRLTVPLLQQQGQAGGSQGVGPHLLGPTRWRQLVLRRLGVIVRPIRQEDWEQADELQRGAMLLQALRL
ncbi:hypothetical protein VOLCADRAFT_101032, partial [Volvox carteri f. nagariensis]